MIIGVVKEIKDQERRVALTPEGASLLARHGHTVQVESGAGAGSGFADPAYQAAGAKIVDTAHAWDTELVLKVKEPQPSEFPYLRRNFLFTYLHLAGVPAELTRALLAAHTTAIAYETVQDGAHRFPLLAPMSAIAGNMAVAVGSYYLAAVNGGKGVQLARILDVRHGKVLVLGDGVVGQHAALAADGIGAHVHMFGLSRKKYQELEDAGPHEIQFVESNSENIRSHIHDADLVIGAVLLPGGRAPCLVTADMVAGMQPGSVLVDVSIDQGGSMATSRPTTHSHPVFTQHGVIHYCVSNMPGAYPRTATQSLTHATLPYALKLADNGLKALSADAGFGKGVNCHDCYVTNRLVAEALGMLSQYREFSP